MTDNTPQYEFSADEEQEMRRQATQARERAAFKLGGPIRQTGMAAGRAVPPLAGGPIVGD